MAYICFTFYNLYMNIYVSEIWQHELSMEEQISFGFCLCLCVGKLSQEEESRNRDTSQTDGHFLLPHVFGVLFGQASLELVRHALVAVLTHGLQIHLHKPVPEQQHRVTDITLRTNSFIRTSC